MTARGGGTVGVVAGSAEQVKFSVGDLELNDVGVELDKTAMAIASRSHDLARERDAYARRLLEERLPRPLHFLLDRPRALKVLLRVVPRWRLTMHFMDLRTLPPGAVRMRPEQAREVARSWLDGKPKGAWVFTYTDPSGLPAEVYL